MINSKSTKDAPPESPARDRQATPESIPFNAFATLLHQGVERLAEMQKNTLDLVTNQTTDAIGAWKKAYPASSSAPGAFVFDLFNQGMEKMAQAQKSVIDLMVQQSTYARDMTLDVSGERRESASKLTHSAADMLSEATERTVAAHKILLDFAAEQNKVIAAAVKKQAGMGGPATAAVDKAMDRAMDTIQHNVDVAIQTQKEIMEAAAKPLKAAAATPHKAA